MRPLAPSHQVGKLACLMSKQDDARRKNLRRQLKDGVEEVTVAASNLRWVLDELSRVQQSNDRLRRQNRRLRLRAGAEAGDVNADAAVQDTSGGSSSDQGE